MKVEDIKDKILFLIVAEAKAKIEELKGSLSSASGVYTLHTNLNISQWSLYR